MEVVYCTTDYTPFSAPQKTSLGFRKSLEAVKSGVRIENVAGDYGKFQPAGSERLLGRCVSPTHEDRTPSMSIYLDTQRFKCYGCGAGGDVLDLVMLAEGGELWTAMVSLSVRYGIELPGRPGTWYRKQQRQKPVRDELDRLRVEITARRLYRILEPMVLAVEDPMLREEIYHDVRAALWRQAEHIVSERREENP